FMKRPEPPAFRAFVPAPQWRAGTWRQAAAPKQPMKPHLHFLARPRWPAWLTAWLMVVTLAQVAHPVRAAEQEFLQPEKAFQCSARAADERHEILLPGGAHGVRHLRER